MGFLDSLNIFKYLEQARFKELDQPATEAVVDALIMTMASDGDIDPRELEEVMDAAELLNWRGDKQIGDYVHEKMEIAASASPNVIPAEAKSIATRVASFDWLVEDVYYLSAKVANADDEVVASETQFLSALTRELGIDSETQRLVIQRIRHESM